MSKFRSFISIFISIVFIVSTIIQFHHHDSNGRMVLFDVEKIELSESNCNDLLRASHHSHNCNESHGGQNEQNCSLKLSITKIVKTTTLQAPYVLSLLYGTTRIQCDDLEDVKYNHTPRKAVIILPEAHSLPSGLRAPPIV